MSSKLPSFDVLVVLAIPLRQLHALKVLKVLKVFSIFVQSSGIFTHAKPCGPTAREAWLDPKQAGTPSELDHPRL